MAEQTNLFEDLKGVLTEFKTFLDQNVGAVRPAIQQITGMFPQVGELIDKLADLMQKLRDEIQRLDVNNVPGLAQVTQFTTMTRSFLTSAKSLMPGEAATIDGVLNIVNVVGSLPSLDAVKQEILTLIDAIKGHIVSLKPT